MTTNYPNEVKWIAAQSINDGEWIVRGLYIGDGWAHRIPELDNSRMMDTTPIGEMKQSAFAIFRNRPNWQDSKPRRLLDLRDKRDWPIMGCGSLINSVNSDFTINTPTA